MADKDIIRLEHLSKIYSDNGAESIGINDVNLSFSCSEFVIVTGESGAGKSTLLKVIGAMDSFEDGEMFFFNRAISGFSDAEIEKYRDDNIAFIFQEMNVIESLSVRDNVELSLVEHEDNNEKAVNEILKKTGLARIAAKKAAKLSGGQKQRVSIARALAAGKRIILADEPTAHLDEENAKEIAELLADAAKQSLVIVSTHNKAVFEEYATREIHLDNGKTVSDLYLKNEASKEEIRKDKGLPDNKEKKSVSIFKSAWMWGTRFFLSKTKTAALIFMIFLVAGLFLMLFTGVFTLQIQKYISSDGKVFRGGKNRVVVAKKNGDTFSSQEISEIKNRYPSADFVRCDVLMDSGDKNQWYEFMCDPTEFEAYNTSDYTLPFIIDMPSGVSKPEYGRLPENESECMLVIPYALRNYFDESCVDKRKISLYKAEYKIVGLDYYIDNSVQGRIILSKEGYDICSLMAYIGAELNVRYSIENTDGEKYNFDKEDVRYSFDAEEGKIFIRHDLPDGSNTAKCSLQFVKNVYNEKTGSSKRYEVGDKFDEAHIFFNEGEVMYWEEGTVLVNPLTIKQTFSDFMEENYRQFSLSFSDRKEALKALKTLQSEGFFALNGDTRYKVSGEDAKYGVLFTIAAFAGEVFILLIIGLLIYFCFSKIMQALKNDITVMRSAGISKKYIRVSVYAFFAVPFVIAQLIVFIATILIYYHPFFNRNLLWIGILNRLLLAAGIFALALFAVEFHRKKYLDLSVSDAFRKDA